MLNPLQIEEAFKEFMGDLPKCAHDGVIPINLNFLHEQGLLANWHAHDPDHDDLTQYFHVIESAEKVTLFNEQFVVWIIPRTDHNLPVTFVMIALAGQEKPHLEIVFTTSGVYNTPRYVLKILQHFLHDVVETEATLSSMEKAEPGS